jgi:hypothetical protein
MDSDLSSFLGNPLAELVVRRFRCRQRILVVTDGALSFGSGSGLGLSEFVGILRAAGHTVATVHRRDDSFLFNTAATSVTPLNYDQLWLFGFSTTEIDSEEQAVIATFMQRGGGLFATGDHASIGRGMGAHIPRVRAMRNWQSTTIADVRRLDTVTHPGADTIKQFDDQADCYSQRIWPLLFATGGLPTDPRSWAVHPLLRHPSGAIDVLPDHSHEGECIATMPAAGVFAGVDEWPLGLDGRCVAPEVIAVSLSTGGFITDILYPPVHARSFGAISVYDGHAASVGRIVCDATWHHFVNVNLNGTGAVPDTTGARRTGLYSGGSPTADYLKIQRYYLNTVRWLAPRQHRFCWAWLVTAALRFDFEVLELQLPIEQSWQSLMRAGLVVENATIRHWGYGSLADIVDDILLTANVHSGFTEALKKRAGDEGGDSLIPIHLLRRAVLASAVNRLAQALPEDEKRLESILAEMSQEQAHGILKEAVSAAQSSIVAYLHQALETTKRAIEVVTPS